jgi:hypothetical protein
MKDRLNNRQQPQAMATDALLSGSYYAFEDKISAPKSFKSWVLPYNTPATGEGCAAYFDVGQRISMRCRIS